MTPRPGNKQPQGADLVGQVDELADQVKNLALNLAITLAREKERVKDLKIIEPEFTHLINKSVGVVREITNILMSIGAEEPRMTVGSDRLMTIEKSLEEILIVAENVLKEIRVLKQRKGMVDKYK
jgi:methyl-accepting chemotaxis protein